MSHRNHRHQINGNTEWLSVAAASAKCGLTEEEIREAIDAKELTSTQRNIGRLVFTLVKREDVNDLVERLQAAESRLQTFQPVDSETSEIPY